MNFAAANMGEYEGRSPKGTFPSSGIETFGASPKGTSFGASPKGTSFGAYPLISQ